MVEKRRPEVKAEVIRSNEKLDFDDWARRLVEYTLQLEAEKPAGRSQPHTAA
jgi:hypothetical protein